jgi:molybdopterin synthase sulfur carrier subunit
MSVRLKVPTQLRQLTGGAAELDVEAASIRELLEKVGGDHPELLERVLDEGGEIRRFVNLYVGDEDVRFLDGIDTPLKDGEVVVILPAVAGGQGPMRS